MAEAWDDVVSAISVALNEFDTPTLKAVAEQAEEINAEGWLVKVIREYLMVWRATDLPAARPGRHIWGPERMRHDPE